MAEPSKHVNLFALVFRARLRFCHHLHPKNTHTRTERDKLWKTVGRPAHDEPFQCLFSTNLCLSCTFSHTRTRFVKERKQSLEIGGTIYVAYRNVRAA